MVRTWNELVLPVLAGVGERWRTTGAGVEVEHLLSECAEDALRAGDPAAQPGRVNPRPVLLAALESEDHRLPLHALAAALAERRIAVRMLGARLPMQALADAVTRTGARCGLPVVPGCRAASWRRTLTLPVPAVRPAPALVLGGPRLGGRRSAAGMTWCRRPRRRRRGGRAPRSGGVPVAIRASLGADHGARWSPRPLLAWASGAGCGEADARRPAGRRRAGGLPRPPRRRGRAAAPGREPLAAEHDLPAEAAAAGWLLGVCLAAAGRYGGALDVLDAAVRRRRRRAGRDAGCSAALGEATLASVHRQLGRHAEARATTSGRSRRSARPRERPASTRCWGWPPTPSGSVTRTTARGRLGEAAALADGRADWWRQRVRLGWVRAEVALLRGPAAAAAVAARGAVDLAEQSGAPRHVAKGLLFQGVAQVEAGRARGGGRHPAPRPACSPRAWAPCRCCGRPGRCSAPCWPTEATRGERPAASTRPAGR